ncbi:TPA: hypothetical protein N0F65_007915 [Lagenidium giganteum]|uniref:Retrovirus-related Pol polyprotein from transposon TNT 1-94-like beta-barrel domain-containing protein n=1 Tax=Lagenidium giganteum TaxID=4803 RepID=A0AAV2Z1V2_9STRA|nr:TPA: hypothetical protein N0F65_007915 [Lagenidium giganteum]
MKREPTSERTQRATQASTDIPRVPTSKDGKIEHRPFDSTEVCKGLGSGFQQWANSFAEEITVGEEQCQSLGRVIHEMKIAFTVTLTTAQTVELFRAKKPDSQSWHEHMLYLMAAKNATGASEALVLENSVEYASPSMRNLLVNRVDETHDDFAVHARELATWAQSHDEKARSTQGLGAMIGSVTHGGGHTGKRDTRTCNYCKIKGHIERDCRKKAKGIKPSDGDSKTDFALSSVNGDDLHEDDWVLDSGASVHLVRNKSMLHGTLTTEEGCVLPDGSKLLVTHRGTAKVTAIVDGIERTTTLSNACYSSKVAVNLISMGTLLEKGCALEKRRGRLAMVYRGQVRWYLSVRNRVLVVDRSDRGQNEQDDPLDIGKIVLNAVRDAESTQSPTKHPGTLVHFHMRFGHLSYDTKRMADAPNATVELTDRRRPMCLERRIETGTYAASSRCIWATKSNRNFSHM